MMKKIMMMEVEKTPMTVLRIGLAAAATGDHRAIVPVRGGIKRRILALLYKQLKMGTQSFIHYFLTNSTHNLSASFGLQKFVGGRETKNK
ncbi:hypothetical protein VitviT2T_026998 [Vitis vinifera]|uniref:Uncharacterized protein n=2 Tax=Vitis vinifera TaxID=29760 RepID=A0ABY9DQK0_VITVI|nr:hypothetical protein VitviT2T_026998 [Vitis vinifera]